MKQTAVRQSYPSIFEEIRQKTALVMKQAQDVRLNDEVIEDYTNQIINLYPPEIPEMTDDWHLIDRKNPTRTALYVLVLDSINFGSGYFESIKPHDGLSGYALVASCLKEAFEYKFWDQITVLAGLNPEDCAKVFYQDISDPDIEQLMALFVWSIQITIDHLNKEYNGSVPTLLEKTGMSAMGLVDAVSRWENFADFSVYKGHEVPFLKRAQILAADMHLSYGGTLFTDMDQVTIFADNQVPHVLHLDGVLSYSDDLSGKIASGHLFEQGDPQEVEIRAAVICAVEKMVQIAIKQGDTQRTAFWFDQVLWHRGLEDAFTSQASHRAKTIFY